MTAATLPGDAQAGSTRSTLDARRSPWSSLVRLAWRESRTARRRLLLYMSSIALGVAALVAIDSFAGNVGGSVREQSRALLGGDVAFQSRRPFPKPALALLDSLPARGMRVARTTQFASMGLVPRTGRTRLVQVRAVEPGYPFYGEVTTQPVGRWAALHTAPHALVDRSLLVALDAQIGDTLVLGYGRFRIDGTLDNVPGDAGIASVIGPRVYIPARYLAETQLLVFGSRAEYEAVVKLPDGQAAAPFLKPLRANLDEWQVRGRTVADTERGLTEAVDRLTDFLSIVGLIALLLGGVGVASGVSAFVARKIDTVAVLRCLGATSRQILAIYVTQAAIMGLVGALAGALIGIGIQVALPRVLGDFLPVDVRVSLEPAAIGAGVVVGVWVALVFALRPLLALRRVSPLQAIRREVDPGALRGRGIDWANVVVGLAVVASVTALAVQRTGRLRDGIGITAAIFGAIVLLWLSATAASALARRSLRAGWPYVVRQGVANLYRPGSQTRAVTLALGFGAFLVSTIYLVQSNLLRTLDVRSATTRANVLFFDVQEDQAAFVDSALRVGGNEVVSSTPIVTMRIAAVNGRTTAAMLADSARRGERWPLRREYRSTYRTTQGDAERVTAGTFFKTDAAEGALPEVSFEAGVARELGLSLGDTVTWDVQGVQVPSRVTSFREVNWQRFEPNFFAVFQPAALVQAPKQFVIMARVPSADAVARLQRDVVARHPNVSSVDLSLIQRTVGGIIEKVSVAVRFLGIFCLAVGVPVLVSAVAATRRDRLRDAVLLKTLGATRAQIGRILLAEYAVLGALGAFTGMLLSFGGAWALQKWVFRGPFAPDWGAALGIAALLVAFTLAIGFITGREAFRETPMAALRES
ncbi:FtsX-like permease family protein [Roseisolibacter sp. H3M3-2]|uniref:ABC transporter permease n=1 Tax=Roseisolibacter sp. H3M3-2 TaxID=3031323 RepID=UPI0023DBDAB1|nr:FtsX-like permease family protein [Roseisolibacter sp. H3M3-2]MDF1501305.1 ABC transporter permease [Roseisolibacter sp. H3M3-2]